MTAARSIARHVGPRERETLLRAIGAGRVVREDGRDWRYTGGTTRRDNPPGVYQRHKYRVQTRVLDQLAAEGLIHLGPGEVWCLTDAEEPR